MSWAALSYDWRCFLEFNLASWHTAVSGTPDRCERIGWLLGFDLSTAYQQQMIRRNVVAALAAALFAASAAWAEPNTAGRESASTQAAEPAKDSGSRGFKQDVKRAWSDTRAGIHRAGREVGQGARSFGRATRDAFRSGWRKVKESFAGAPDRSGGAG